MKKISVFITTIGRETLINMLESLVNELTEKDYLYIFIDGKHNENKARTIINKIINLFVCEVIIKVEDEPLGNWGHGLRNKYQSTLKGDYIMHADDDDTYIKGSFNKIREKINETDNDETIFYYRFNYRYNSNLTVWYTPELMGGNIGTPSGVIPNKPELFGEWKNKHGGDYDFYSTCKFTNQIFVDEIIYVVNSYIEKVDDVKLKIGIVIPTYQRQDGLSFVYLTNALNSIKNQTFKDYKVFVVENDSKDDTRNILLDWADSSDDKVFVLGCNGVNLPECKLNMKPTIEHDTSDYRINKMATLRNIYLEELKNHDDIDLVIVWDFDIVGKLDMNGFYLSGYRLTQDENINVICANGIRKEGPFYVYYDTYAYREHGDDYRAKSYYDFKYSRPTTCEGNLPLKYVRSCFGGLTIYRKDALLSSTYGTRKNKANNTICEHEYLHERIDGVYHSNELLYLIDKS